MLIGAGVVALLLSAILGFVAYLVFHQVKGQFFDSAGVTIHYTSEGTGTPVVLIHGFAANSTLNWRVTGIHRQLARHYRVITMDVRGHGLSDKPKDPAKYGAEMVEDVRRLLDHLDIPKAHIVGYSMGGMICMKFMALHPDRCISAAPLGIRRLTPADKDMLKNIVKRYSRQHTFHDAWAELNHGHIPPQLESFAIKRLTDLDALEALTDNVEAIMVADTELVDNKIPAILLIGSNDWMINGVADMQKTVGNLECAIIEGGTHTTTLKKKAFTSQLMAFLSKHS